MVIESADHVEEVDFPLPLAAHRWRWYSPRFDGDCNAFEGLDDFVASCGIRV